jgi:hypothetical protein
MDHMSEDQRARLLDAANDIDSESRKAYALAGLQAGMAVMHWQQ